MNELFILAGPAWKSHIMPKGPRKPHSLWQPPFPWFDLGDGLALTLWV